ncbi:MAG: hypothetical protein KGL39_40395 [Patescibacteria group bacterium]|nr:hypothetical protein [Patescibacteria group bacterium]
MSAQSGYVGVFCPRCDRAGTPARVVRQMAAKQEGMLVKCNQCGAIYNYQQLMSTHPRMDKVDFVEKPPAGYVTIPLWLHPEVVEAWKRKFPSNWQTTLSSAMTALADPDAVLIEGEYAREMASIGIRRGREVLGLAKKVKDLEEEVAALRLREQTLRQFFSGLGLAMPQPANQPPSSALPSADPVLPPVGPDGRVLTPPRAQFSSLQDDGSGLLVPADGSEPVAPSQFSFPQGAAPAADVRPSFIVNNLR